MTWARAISAQKTSIAVPALAEAMKDENEYVRRHAADALEAIRRKS
jgi:HEAT repeat protein